MVPRVWRPIGPAAPLPENANCFSTLASMLQGKAAQPTARPSPEALLSDYCLWFPNWEEDGTQRSRLPSFC